MKKLIATAVLALFIAASTSAGDLETGPLVTAQPTPTPTPEVVTTGSAPQAETDGLTGAIIMLIVSVLS